MIDIKIDSAELENQLTALVDKIQHREPLMRDIAGIMADAVEENFAQEGRPKWLGIKRDGKVLQDKGRLAASNTAFSDNDNAVVGTNSKYAAIHHFGGVIKKKARTQSLYFKQNKDGSVGRRFVRKSKSNFSQTANIGAHQVTMPARPFLTLSNDDINEIEHAVSEYLVKIIK
ncbi:phage virion morphogenesis protein [Limnobaculum xujianqingii]|uniref:phage virion morphogenesis protein n=1 Tax=Limnobaculum xujianqingii TaxID=2738837 RepID=UPI00112DE50E|nr:phage virion morphogenesis protein [Limnobaculum xujianqingii]